MTKQQDFSSRDYLNKEYPNNPFNGGIASIYALTFLEAGNGYDTFRSFDPFNSKRSTGVGVRIFMPMFGLLGFDFAHGYDPIPGAIEKSGWQTHFSIGQQF